jgi:hypothetical protein
LASLTGLLWASVACAKTTENQFREMIKTNPRDKIEAVIVGILNVVG